MWMWHKSQYAATHSIAVVSARQALELKTATTQSPLNAEYADQNNGPAILAVVGTFCAAAVIVVAMRLYARIRKLGFIGADDWIMTAATVLGVAMLASFIGEVRYGVGRHTSTLSASQMRSILQWQFYHSLWVMFGVSLVKISIAVFLMRLAPHPSWKRFLAVIIGFLICFTAACAGTLIFACMPVQASWDVKLAADPRTKCFSAQTFADIGLFNSVVNIATDFLFATIPIPIIWNLQMNTRTKISLVAILSLGYFACAAGIVKAKAQADYPSNTDRTYHDTFFVWNALELYIGILAASLPAVKPLFSSILTSARTGLSGSRSKSYTNPRGRSRTTGGIGPGIPGSGYHSRGYQRHQDLSATASVLANYELKGLSSPTTVITSTTQSGGSEGSRESVMRHKRPYHVHVTSGDLGDIGVLPDGDSEHSEGGDTRPKSSSESTEGLRGGIMRTTEVKIH